MEKEERDTNIHTDTKSLGYKSPDLQWLKVMTQSYFHLQNKFMLI